MAFPWSPLPPTPIGDTAEGNHPRGARRYRRHVAEEKYRLLFQEMQEGVFLSTARRRLLDCNEAFVRMLGFSSREELMALTLDRDVYASAERRETFRREMELHTTCGTLRCSCGVEIGSPC